MSTGKIWLSSDPHLFHNKPFIYEARGFKTIEEMNWNIIKNYQDTVDYDDEFYILGDLILGGAQKTDEEIYKTLTQIPGHIHIILGNHDTDRRANIFRLLPQVLDVVYADKFDYGGLHFYLSHYPTITCNYDDDKGLRMRLFNLCGHTHTKDKWANWNTGSYHVEVDAHNCKPVDLDTIVEEIRDKYQKEQR